MKLNGANIDIAIGGVDFSFNEDEDGLYEPHWCPHIHLVGWTTNESKLKAALKKQFPKDDITKTRPTHVKEFDGTRYGISYLYKITFESRVRYRRTKKGCRDTKYRKLTSDQRVELALFLHTVGLGARLISVGLRPFVGAGRLRLKRAGP